MNEGVFLTLSAVVSGSLTLLLVKSWIPVARKWGLVGKDLNKPDKPEVPEAGGLWVLIGISFGILTLEALYTYINNEYYKLTELFSVTIVLLLSGLLGFIDDILGWHKGLPVWGRVLFMAPIAIPLVVIKAGVPSMELPLIGTVNFGILYPLIIIPIGVLGAANAFNMIAGYNGLEAGMGLILLGFTAIYSYMEGLKPIFELTIIGIASLIAFLYFNLYPARVFPGNSFTYGFGAFYASLVILGDFQKFGVSLFILYFLEFALFVRGLSNGIYKENFAKVESDSLLYPPYDRVYSLTHLAIKIVLKLKGRGAKEYEVVAIIWSLQIFVGIVAILLFT